MDKRHKKYSQTNFSFYSRTDDSSASGFALLYQMSFAKTLNEMNDNVQIVRYMETRDIHFMMQYKAAIKYLDKVQKDVDESDFYRTQGNVQYSQRNYVQALELFNQSICFAPEGSVELSKGYANRSAVYLSLKMYGLCLENIKLARDAGYPKDLMSKLDERQTKCENGLKKQKVPENEFNGLKPELTYPPHEKVPFIANCLELKRNQRFGRHIVAKSDLKVGDIIAIERPFNNGVVAREIRYNCCANCLNDNDLSLIPCSSCHSAMFCSQKCYAEAKANFHDIECPIMSVLFDAILLHSDERLVNVKEIVAVRLLIALIRSFESLDQLMRFVKDLDNREQNVFTIDYAKNEQLASLAAILQLERNQTKSGHKMKNSMGLATGIIYKILLSSTALKEIFKTKEEVDFFIGIFYRFVQVINFSSFPVTNVMKKFAKPEEKTNKYDRLCYGIYPFSSLMNHSCAPNTVHIKHGLDNVIIVIKPVKAGEQLFISYE